jgi:hypothetical protein
MPTSNAPGKASRNNDKVRSRVVWEKDGRRGVFRWKELPPNKRPQDPSRDGTGLRFETLEHGGARPDMFPLVVRITDQQGRTAQYEPFSEPRKENERPQDDGLASVRFTLSTMAATRTMICRKPSRLGTLLEGDAPTMFSSWTAAQWTVRGPFQRASMTPRNRVAVGLLPSRHPAT